MANPESDRNDRNVRVYQELLAPSAISNAAGQTSGSAVYLCSAAVGANARTCRDEAHCRRLKIGCVPGFVWHQ